MRGALTRLQVTNVYRLLLRRGHQILSCARVQQHARGRRCPLRGASILIALRRPRGCGCGAVRGRCTARRAGASCCKPRVPRRLPDSPSAAERAPCRAAPLAAVAPAARAEHWRYVEGACVAGVRLYSRAGLARASADASTRAGLAPSFLAGCSGRRNRRARQRAFVRGSRSAGGLYRGGAACGGCRRAGGRRGAAGGHRDFHLCCSGGTSVSSAGLCRDCTRCGAQAPLVT